jgi:hypothetical protein
VRAPLLAHFRFVRNLRISGSERLGLRRFRGADSVSLPRRIMNLPSATLPASPHAGRNANDVLKQSSELCLQREGDKGSDGGLWTGARRPDRRPKCEENVARSLLESVLR